MAAAYKPNGPFQTTKTNVLLSPEEDGQEGEVLRDGRRVCQATRPVTGKEEDDDDDDDDDMFLLIYSIVNNQWISCSVAK